MERTARTRYHCRAFESSCAARLMLKNVEIDPCHEYSNENERTITVHYRVNGQPQGPVRVSNSGGALPGGIEPDVDYQFRETHSRSLKRCRCLSAAITPSTAAVTSATSAVLMRA